MVEIIEGLVSLKAALALAKDASEIAKNASSTEMEVKRQQIEIAAEKLRQSAEVVEAQIAESFGYQLCKCTFPPSICLKTRIDEKSLLEIYECPACAQEYPAS